jgi:hypothetical protein
MKRAAVRGSEVEIDALIEFANSYAAAHPETPFGRALRSDFPRELKSMAEEQRTLRHAAKEMKLYEVYSRLSFAPKDAEIEARLAGIRSRFAESDGALPDGALEHSPPRFSPSRQDIEITASWPGAPAGISATIHYRSRHTLEWKEAPLRTGRSGLLTGRIPAEDVVPPFVGYYLEAHDSAGHSRRIGSAASPLRIRIERR